LEPSDAVSRDELTLGDGAVLNSFQALESRVNGLPSSTTNTIAPIANAPIAVPLTPRASRLPAAGESGRRRSYAAPRPQSAPSPVAVRTIATTADCSAPPIERFTAIAS
jgi:hypothetical protein